MNARQGQVIVAEHRVPSGQIKPAVSDDRVQALVGTLDGDGPARHRRRAVSTWEDDHQVRVAAAKRAADSDQFGRLVEVSREIMNSNGLDYHGRPMNRATS